ncbi:VOC family protein [Pseudactinotalea sp.]|uniref:VOC family protein n=1 Tax=Pseudactinotalea sp. TaxID=1926260 RepID=UPI003B3A31BD
MRLQAVTYGAQDPELLARFWAGMLERDIVVDDDGMLLPGADGQLGLRFEADDAPPQPRHRMHLHLTSTSLADQQATVDRACDLGARHLDVGQLPEDGHVVLADPAGFEFCVIEPGNGFLAGTGALGEVSGDGTRAVGYFWSAALGWPLVWDRGDQTVIQAPGGGTKVSWDVWPEHFRGGADQQRLELVTDSGALDAEIDSLVRLGATHLRTTDGAALLADPDGSEFRLR